jgi:hypothetical protein
MNFSSLLIKSATVCLAVLILIVYGCSGDGSGQVLSKNTATLSGIIRYQDKEYDSLGFTGTNPFKTVRYAVVEVVDSVSNKVLASGTTGSDGSYTISYSGAGPSVSVRVLAEAEINNTPLVRVRDLSGSTYAVASGSILSGGTGTINLDIDLVTYSLISGAFNILDVLTSGMQFVNDLAGVYPPQLSAFWEVDSPVGTFYATSGIPGAGIYIRGNYVGDTDGYDDDVILHEFGHFIADNFSRDDSPGGAHYLGQNDEDLRLSWSEGWGNFMPLAIKKWLSATDPTRLSAAVGTSPSLYVDTVNDVAYIAFDFGNPRNNTTTCLPSGTSLDCFNYSSNEAGVANILWNLMTGPTGSFGMQPIWSVISSWHNLSTSKLSLVNLESFWDGWISQRSPGGNEYDPSYAAELSTLWSIYAPLNGPLPGPPNIFYRKDTYDVGLGDGSFTTATSISVSSPQTHYLYSATGLDDSDYFIFVPSSSATYTVTTSGLSNGADTYVAVYNSGQNLIAGASNDNFNNVTYIPCYGSTGQCPGGNYDYYDFAGNYHYPSNDALTLSSSASFSATSGATYYIEVKPSPNRPVSAGRYGTYTITVQ